MTSMGAQQAEAAPIMACAVARDIQSFDLLIEDMETELGEQWGGLSFEDAFLYLDQPEASELDFIAIAVDQDDEDDVSIVARLIAACKNKGIKVILVAHDVSPIALHQLLRFGADDFAPYPLPDGALHEAVGRLRDAKAAPQVVREVVTVEAKPGAGRDGAVLAIQGLGGGVGATTFTVNLAWELVLQAHGSGKKVCILDFDLQFGSISTFLDLNRREAVFEVLSDTEAMDPQSFQNAMQSFNERLDVLTAPPELLPLELVSPEDISRIIEMAREQYDFVLVDMPKTLVQWTETVLNAADVFFGVIELDMRSAQNTLRFVKALKAEGLPHEKVRFTLNRAPKFTDLTGKGRVKRMAESLNISVELHLPDGGKQVTQSCDHGLPISETAAKNPLRREIMKLAGSLYALSEAVATG